MRKLILTVVIIWLLVAIVSVAQGPKPGGGSGGAGGTTYTFSSPLSESGGTVTCPSCPVLLNAGSTTFSAVASVDFPTIITSAYNEYQVKLMGIVNSADGAELYMRVSVNGSTFDATNGNYNCGTWAIGNSGGTLGCGLGTAIKVVDDSTVSSGEHIVSWVRFFQPTSTTLRKYFITDGFLHYTDQTTHYRIAGGGRYNSTTALTGIQFFPETGTFSGSIFISGIAN